MYKRQLPYGSEPALEMEYEDRKIRLPENLEEKPSFPVRKYHIDTNEHVNNCQYVQMALEVLPEETRVRQIRVEYKKSAVLGDVIFPKVAREENRIVTELCDENGKPYKSSGGKMVWDKRLKREIPLLWKAKIVEEVADVYNGATPSTVNELNYGGDIVWITPKDLSDQKQKFVYQGERNISQVGYDSCSTHLLPSNTILMSSRAPIGLLAIAKTELCTNQGFKSFVSKSKNIATYLYYYLQYHITQIEQLGTGTTFKEVSREDILKFPMLKPSDNVLDLWEEIVSALNDRQLEIQKENENLIKQRDELLPLLMNGQVSVNYDLSHD